MSCVLGSLIRLRDKMREDGTLQRDATILAIVDALGLAVIAALAYFYYRWWSTHPLYGRNSGSKAYPIVGTAIPFLINRGRALEYGIELIQKSNTHTYRAVLPINRCGFITANPANIEYILKTNFVNYPKGENINKHFRSLFGDGIFNADDDLWKIQRKVASHEFTTRSLTDFGLETAQRETNDRLLPVLSAAAQSGRTLDMQDILSRFSLDNICQLGFGVDTASLTESMPDVEFAEAFDSATRITAERVQTFPRWLWKIKTFFDVGNAKKLRLDVAVIDEFAMRVIESRREELESTKPEVIAAEAGEEDAERLRGGRTDLLSRFMTLVNIGNDENHGTGGNSKSSVTSGGGAVINKPSNVFLRDIIINFMLAGKDSSTSALSWFFWLLSSHPDVESAILEEISAVLNSRGRSDSTREDKQQIYESDFTFHELKGMNYLTAAITESMRLYPPIPVDVKTARKADVLPNGMKVPAGSIVGYHPFAMARLENLWGKDCLSFKPERWLNNQRVFVPASPFKYSVFHAGPRMCLGKDLSLMQMKIICAAVLKNFQLIISPDYKPKYELSITLRMKHGLPLQVRRRIASCSQEHSRNSYKESPSRDVAYIAWQDDLWQRYPVYVQ